jgi:hypothetical protein
MYEVSILIVLAGKPLLYSTVLAISGSLAASDPAYSSGTYYLHHLIVPTIPNTPPPLRLCVLHEDLALDFLIMSPSGLSLE